MIQKKRIRNIALYVSEELQDQELRVGIPVNQIQEDRLKRVGFTNRVAVGEIVLPSIIGPISRFNAEGRQKVRRGLPMETAYRQVEWHWTEYHGDQQVERSDFRDVPYSRYPREFIPPPSLELEVLKNPDGQKVISTPSSVYNEQNKETVLHAINLMLEFFGECEIYNADILPAIELPVERLNWRLLPPGRYPWERLRRSIQPILERAKQGNVGVISRRLDIINSLGPEFRAVGEAGFTGYVVFGFPDVNLYILESCLYGNATYVFEEGWEELSKRTKAEILNENLQKARIIHRSGWEERIRRLLR